MGDRNLIFYADDRRTVGRDHIRVQYALTVTVAMFGLVGIDTNLDKTKALVRNPRYIWGDWSEEAYKRRASI